MTDGLVTATSAQELVAEATAAGIERLTVGAVIVQSGKVLLLLRPADDFMPDGFELPSGKVEAGETLLEALARETLEKTALAVTGVTGYLGVFDYVSGSGRATRQFNFAVSVAAFGPLVLSEHADFLWAPLVAGLPVTSEVAEVLGFSGAR
jgi:8-oxo-dGTP diphosphatase